MKIDLTRCAVFEPATADTHHQPVLHAHEAYYGCAGHPGGRRGRRRGRKQYRLSYRRISVSCAWSVSEHRITVADQAKLAAYFKDNNWPLNKNLPTESTSNMGNPIIVLYLSLGLKVWLCFKAQPDF